MKRIMDIEELDFLEEHLYDEKLYKYYELNKEVKEYVLKARRLPFEDIVAIIDYYYNNNVNAKEYIDSISKKYNSNCNEIVERLREVDRITNYREKRKEKKLMKNHS